MNINQLHQEMTRDYIWSNILEYEDFEEYSEANHVTLEEFENYKESGFIQDITCGTYNGATDTFDPWEISLDNLIDTILQDIRDCEYYEVLNDYADIETSLDYVKAYIEMYNVFTIGEQVFVDLY